MTDAKEFPVQNDHALAGECEEFDRRFACWPDDTLTPIDGVDYHVCQLADLEDPTAKIMWLKDRVSDACVEIADTGRIAERAIKIARQLLEAVSNGDALPDAEASKLCQILDDLDEYNSEQEDRIGDLLFQENLDNRVYRGDRARRDRQIEP